MLPLFKSTVEAPSAQATAQHKTPIGPAPKTRALCPVVICELDTMYHDAERLPQSIMHLPDPCNKAERIYTTTECELFAIVFTALKWRHHLESLVDPPLVYTDHKALTKALNFTNKNRRINRAGFPHLDRHLETSIPALVYLPTVAPFVNNMTSQMKIWDTIYLSGDPAFKAGGSLNIHGNRQAEDERSDEEERRAINERPPDINLPLHSLQRRIEGGSARKIPTTQPGITYQFSAAASIWEPVRLSVPLPSNEQMPSTMTISSYNVLVDSISPAARDRYALLLRSLLSESAVADTLVLQEVSDDFLSYLLEHDTIRSRYPFTTHGPPDQPGVGPLASLRNIIVLSRWNFSWEWIPFEKRHEGAVVLSMETIGKSKVSTFLPLIVGGIYLSCGLTDSSVAAKNSQLQTLVKHLSRNYPENPWLVAGGFNLTTSAFTIDAALKSKSISLQTASTITLETMLSEARLSDSWLVARAETGDTSRPTQGQVSVEDLYEGEEGATFDPAENTLAAETAGRGLNTRPQRYDRILVKAQDFLEVTGFNVFGFPEENGRETDDYSIKDQDTGPHCGSDHWGIRATLRTDPVSRADQLGDINIQLTPLELRRAPLSLSDVTALKLCLTKHSMFPTEEEVTKRKEVFALVKSILQQSQSQGPGDMAGNNRSNISIVVVPVGSYGLGVWSTLSDIDCLCIGPFSTKIFFALASQRLRKAADLGVRILRKVKAASGTMLELEVRGVKLDLQYCPAAKIVDRWPEVTRLSSTDPLFDLSILSLRKLQAFRDLDYIQRTIPDLAAFRISCRFIRLWAQQRGIYSSKFGYLGGIHITMMLSRICKLLFRDAGAITAADIICMFFNHYANFDWKTEMVFDPFFNKQQPRYHRSAREPMVILSLRAPVVNVAHTASVPSLETLIKELKRADDLLSEVGVAWPMLIGGTGKGGEMADVSSGAQEFPKTYNSYIKINVQYWGLTLAKGSALVGWLESRCVHLLVDINRKLPGVHARIWPARFTLHAASGKDERDYEGCYLIALAKGENAKGRDMTESDRQVSQGALREALEQFSDQIRSSEKYFDATSSWVDVAHVKQSELGNLKLDDREWGDYVIQDESDTEDEAEGIALELDDEDDEAATAAFPASRKTPAGGKKTTKPVATKKLRRATDILNRLRWDPSLDSSDHVVGYEDRFSGTREIAVDQWKTEQTEEEFIPQHRILYFQRRSDGVVVWERETRRDDIFGSGAGRVE
ncbi:hypothetical protein V500_01547 [Pseudogymnoascus sp. VKM F-4518 (FW-2643)]|nr:hypothetical protein V500_01547 [Pseudogymnoascus sp. VKM F-4518 (FW-2643)]